MSGNEMNGQVMLIVGGTSGLGLSATRSLVDNGARVVVMGRSEKK